MDIQLARYPKFAIYSGHHSGGQFLSMSSLFSKINPYP